MNKIVTQKLTKPLAEIRKATISSADFIKTFTPEQQQWIKSEAEYFMLSMEICKTRNELALTQQELADRMYIPRSTISKIESGKRNVTVETLQKMAKAMGKRLVIEFQ